MDSVYEYEHECEAMPTCVTFYKLRQCSTSTFAVESSVRGALRQSTAFYGFRYCPYCGEDMEVRDD